MELETIAPGNATFPDAQYGQGHNTCAGESSGEFLHEETALRRGEEADPLFSSEARHMGIEEIRQDRFNLGPGAKISACNPPLTLHGFQAAAELPLARHRGLQLLAF